MSVQPTGPYKRVSLQVIQEETIARKHAVETMIPGATFLPPKSPTPVSLSDLSPDQRQQLTSALGGYLRAQGYEEPKTTKEGFSDACRRGWEIARGPIPKIDPEVFEAIAKAFGAKS